MRIAIIALILAVAALGLGSFATFKSFDDNEDTPAVAGAVWSEAECEKANDQMGFLATMCRRNDGNCDAYNDMLQAINDNCP